MWGLYMFERSTRLDRQPGGFWRFCLAFLIVVAFSASASLPASAKTKFSALAVDARTGRVLYSQDPDGSRYPASLTKVMTLYLLFQELKAERLTLESRLKVSKHASLMPATKLGVRPGDTIRVEDAIRAIIILSANDVAVVVGENIAGSESAFAKRMTKTARALGMSRTTFRNASGLPNPGQVTTARDMATISLRVQRDFPQYYSYFRTMSFTYGKRVVRTHNRLLGRFAGTDGIKTGYIRASGFNLTTSAQRGDKRIIGVVMGASSGNARNNYMMSMLAKAFPQCKNGEALAYAIQGSKAVSVAALEAAVPAEPVARSTPDKTAKTAVLPDPIPSDFVAANTASDAEDVAEESTADAPKVIDGSTFTSVVVEPPAEAVKTQTETKTGAQDAAKVIIASAEPAATLPFAVKSAKDTGGVVVVPPSNATWKIQIGAYPNKSEAQAVLYKVRSLDNKLFGSKTAFTVEVQLGEATMYRARFSGFSEQLARAACKKLSTKGIGCVALSPQS
ncbi:D-alanyl-D-alanine carboxypeptidase [soil metagenome]